MDGIHKTLLFIHLNSFGLLNKDFQEKILQIIQEISTGFHRITKVYTPKHIRKNY